MIYFLTTKGHEYTIQLPNCDVQSYDSFLARKKVPPGTYVFTDMERMSPLELRKAAELFGTLSEAGFKCLNDPASVMSRYELLRTLYETGVNSFNVVRAEDLRFNPPCQYPVFLRYENDHGFPLTGLLCNVRELNAAIKRLCTDGIPRQGVLIVGYRGEPFDAQSRFRKFTTFRVGHEVFAHQVVIQDNWCVKYGNPGAILPDGYEGLNDLFVKENWHANKIREAFNTANIEYGRADWNIVSGRVEIYEINTNPMLTYATPVLVNSLAEIDREVAHCRPPPLMCHYGNSRTAISSAT